MKERSRCQAMQLSLPARAKAEAVGRDDGLLGCHLMQRAL